MSRPRINAGASLAKQAPGKDTAFTPSIDFHHEESTFVPLEPIAGTTSSRRKSNSGKALAKDLSARKIENNIINITNKRLSPISEILRGKDENKVPYLLLGYPQEDKDNQIINLTFLLELENISEPFTLSLYQYLHKIKPVSRRTFMDNFRAGIFTFLAAFNPKITLSEFNHELLVRYVKWQDSPAASAQTHKSLSPPSCRKRVEAGRAVFKELAKIPEWADEAATILSVYPQRTHAGSSEFSTPRQIFAREVLEKIRISAINELTEIRARFQEGDRLLAEGQEFLSNGNRNYKVFSIALAELASLYPNTLPTVKELRKYHPVLARAVLGNGGKQSFKPPGIYSFSRLLYAYPRDIVPFVLLLTIEGAYNPTTILGLARSGVIESELFGIPITSIDGEKGRGHSGTYGKDLDPDVVNSWLELLERITCRLRNSLSECDKDKLFIFAALTSKIAAKSYGSLAGDLSVDVCWGGSLKYFRKKYNIPNFSLAQIRATLLDLVGQRHGSIAASRAAQHLNFQTTDNHYLGPGTKQREQEKLGDVVQQMERWARSGGQIDVRRSARPEKLDKGAATPGFNCIDPYASPIPGQIEHRLCRAFGSCPICPMASIDITDPLAAAYWLALEKAICRSRETVDPSLWLIKWAPIAARIGSMLKQVPDQVIAASHSHSVYIPSVG